MKRKRALRTNLAYCIILVALLTCVNTSYGSGQSSTNYIMSSDVLSGGGGDTSSTNYDLLSTMGQPTVIGTSSSADYSDFAGFWYQVGEQWDVSIVPVLELLLLQ